MKQQVVAFNKIRFINFNTKIRLLNIYIYKNISYIEDKK